MATNDTTSNETWTMRYNVMTNSGRVTSIDDAPRVDGEIEARKSRIRMANDRIVVWDDGQVDQRWGGRWVGRWPEPVAGDRDVLALLGDLLMYGGYRRWMGHMSRVLSMRTLDSHMYMGRSSDKLEHITVLVTTVDDTGAILDHAREFYLASYCAGDDLSMDTADTVAELWG